MKSRKKKGECYLEWNYTASLRYVSIPYICRYCNVFHPEMHRYKMAWHSVRPPVSTHDFGYVSSCEVRRLQRGLGRAQQAEAVAGATGRA